MNKEVFLIKKPWITEKATRLNEIGQYVFLVTPEATKSEVKKLVKAMYKVDPVRVNIINRQGKNKKYRNVVNKRADLRKAIVTLKSGQKIDLAR
jgi:large subunit ribosomal protein L23